MVPVIINEILKVTPGCKFIGDSSTHVYELISIADVNNSANPNAMSWISDKYIKTAPKNFKLGLLILSPDSYQVLQGEMANFLICDNPRSTFTKILSIFFKRKNNPGIEKSATISHNSTLGKNIYIGHNVVIEKNCKIGDDCIIMHNTVILEGTTIGNNVTIGCNCTIGNYGFGYEKDENGNYLLIEHFGSVLIADNVEVHNNTCIDKGVLGKTIIGANVKIDNLVHVAHGVEIERNALIIANAMLGGSCKIEADSWIAPSTSIKNKITVGKGTLTGIGAVVLKEFDENQTLIGNPATTMEEYKKWSLIRKKLSDH